MVGSVVALPDRLPFVCPRVIEFKLLSAATNRAGESHRKTVHVIQSLLMLDYSPVPCLRDDEPHDITTRER